MYLPKTVPWPVEHTSITTKLFLSYKTTKTELCTACKATKGPDHMWNLVTTLFFQLASYGISIPIVT